MLNIHDLSEQYLNFCKYQKKLSEKTLKAYRIDLSQFLDFISNTNGNLNRIYLSTYITDLHKLYKPKSVKRKIACLKAFCNYLAYEEIIEKNPFDKINVKFQEPFLLPKTISLDNIQKILLTVYDELKSKELSNFKHNTLLRDVTVLELLFATGMRVSELCCLNIDDVNLEQGTVKIFGKGSKERMIQIENAEVIEALKRYKWTFYEKMLDSNCFFINKLNTRLSEQSVRFMIRKYVKKAGIHQHITPHMFRHSFASLLLEEDVDIRFIQQLLGHSSIVTTQIYTHVTPNKQRYILSAKHPRNKLSSHKG